MDSRETRWVEIAVDVPRNAVDDIAGVLGRHCAGGAIIEELRDLPEGQVSETVTVKGFLPIWEEEERQKVEIALLLLSRANDISEPRITILEPRDWAEAWKSGYTAQRIGKHILIVPTWQEVDLLPDDVVIKLDPGMAFGTGLHATTRLCLAAMEDSIPALARVLDVGTGSGILAILAALQGVEHVDAIDNDPIAVRTAQDNIALNNMQDKITVTLGTLGATGHNDIPRHPGTDYDVLLVNILAEIIIQMAPEIGQALVPGGKIIASGILTSKAAIVEDALNKAGIIIDEHPFEGEWTALIGHKE